MNNIQKIKDIQYLINEHYSDKEPLNENQEKSKKCFNNYCKQIEQDLDRLEKQDKALEIFKTKRVDITNEILAQQDYDWYMDYAICHDFISAHLLTRDEFNLLKEVFG